MRDKIKNIEYFDKYINVQYEGIDFYNKHLQDESKVKRHDAFKNQIFIYKLNTMYAMYSKGDTIDEVKEQFVSLIDDWMVLFNTSSYRPPFDELLDMISLFILFDLQEKAKEVCNILTEEEKDDWILNFLLSDNTSNINQITGDILLQKLYLPIRELIIDADIQKIKKYLEKKWYRAHSYCHWYDRHKSEFDIYCGYWAFDIGAIVKKLKLDDSILKDVDYYPYDLVNYKW